MSIKEALITIRNKVHDRDRQIASLRNHIIASEELKWLKYTNTTSSLSTVFILFVVNLKKSSLLVLLT